MGNAHIDIVASLSIALGLLRRLGCCLSLLFLLDALSFRLFSHLLAPLHFFKLKLRERKTRLDWRMESREKECVEGGRR